MAKLIILSIVIVSVGVPAWLSTSPQPRKALRQVQWIVALFVVLWGYMCLHWYPAIVVFK